MKILLTAEFYLSGQSTHVLDLAKQLCNLGHSVKIVITRVYVTDFYTHANAYLQGVSVPCHIGTTKTELHRLIRRFQPDVLHCHSSTIFNLTRNLAIQTGIPYVITCHGLGLEHPRYRQALADAAQIIAIGKNTAETLLPLFSPKTHIIPNGVDTELFVPQRKEKKLRVVYIGRIDSSKLAPIAALNEAVETILGDNLVVVSNNPPNLPGLLHLPWQTDLPSLIGKTNIMAGSGRCAREGMACENAVLLMNRAYDGLIRPALTRKKNFDFSGNIGRYNLSKIESDLHMLIEQKKRLVTLQTFSRRWALLHLSSLEMARRTANVYQQALAPSPDLVHKKIKLSRSQIQGWSLNIMDKKNR